MGSELQDMELVSVIIPVFNAEKLIRNAVLSALNQSYPHVEVIVVDDGSTDGTLRQVRSIEDVRLCVFPQSNAGASAARNAGAAVARGSLLAFLDADDIWFPSFLSTHVEALSRAGMSEGFAYGSYYCVDEHRRLIRRYPCRTLRRGSAWHALTEEGVLLNSISVMRRRVFDEIGGFNLTLKHHEDRAFYVTLATRYEACYTGTRLTIYRQSQAGKARRILDDPERAVVAVRELTQAMSNILGEYDLERFRITAMNGLFCRFTMYGRLKDARGVLSEVDQRDLRQSIKGILAWGSVFLHLNILSVARCVQQTLYALFLGPWWSVRRREAYAATTKHDDS